MRTPDTGEPPGRGIVARGLHLPDGALGVSASEQQAIRAKWNTLEEIEEELAGKGLVAMERPPFEYPGAVTPDQLTTQNNQEYSTLYAQHLGWYNFVALTLARVKAMLLQINNEMDDIEVRIRKELKDQNKRLAKDERFNEKDISDSVSSDQRYKELTLEKQRFDQKKLEYDAYLDNMDRNLKVISRQVEIRRLEHEGGKIEGAMPFRGYQPIRGPSR